MIGHPLQTAGAPEANPTGAASVKPSLRVTADPDPGAWDAFVNSCPQSTGYHLWRWRDVLSGSFGHESVYLAAVDNGLVVGVLPLVRFSSRLFGRFLVSMPFVNYGGILADNESTGHALLTAARDAMVRTGSAHVELRHIGARFQELPVKTHKVAMLLDLPDDSAIAWKQLDNKVRNQIRKAEKSGLTIVDGGPELLDDFYTVFARNMRDLGTPVYAKRFFSEVLTTWPMETKVLAVRHQGRTIAVALTYRFRQTVEVPWASSLFEYRALCPNMLLYWEIMRRAIADEARVLDFGRSTPGEGTYHFKKQWNARPVALHWEYLLSSGQALPDQSPKNPKYQLAIRAWQHMPLVLANVLGPPIVRSIP